MFWTVDWISLFIGGDSFHSTVLPFESLSFSSNFRFLFCIYFWRFKMIGKITLASLVASNWQSVTLMSNGIVCADVSFAKRSDSFSTLFQWFHLDALSDCLSIVSAVHVDVKFYTFTLLFAAFVVSSFGKCHLHNFLIWDEKWFAFKIQKFQQYAVAFAASSFAFFPFLLHICLFILFLLNTTLECIVKQSNEFGSKMRLWLYLNSNQILAWRCRFYSHFIA